jgi:hypothetical protein
MIFFSLFYFIYLENMFSCPSLLFCSEAAPEYSESAVSEVDHEYSLSNGHQEAPPDSDRC